MGSAVPQGGEGDKGDDDAEDARLEEEPEEDYEDDDYMQVGAWRCCWCYVSFFFCV